MGKMHFYKYIYTSKSNFLTNKLVKRLQKLSPSLEMPKQFITNLSRENNFFLLFWNEQTTHYKSHLISIPSLVYVRLIFVYCLV